MFICMHVHANIYIHTPYSRQFPWESPQFGSWVAVFVKLVLYTESATFRLSVFVSRRLKAEGGTQKAKPKWLDHHTTQRRCSGLSASRTSDASRHRAPLSACCSVLQCTAVCSSVLRCVTVRCSVLQCVTVCCSVLPCVAVCWSSDVTPAIWPVCHKRRTQTLQLVAVCGSVFQCWCYPWGVTQQTSRSQKRPIQENYFIYRM